MIKTVNTSNLLPPFEEIFNLGSMQNMLIRPEAMRLARKIGDGENLYIFLGSSGAGRDTVLEACLNQIEKAVRLRRTTTRKPREYIQDQERLLFITEKSFLTDFKKGKLLFAGKYKVNGQLYGISKDEISRINLANPCLLEENFSGLPLKVMFPKSKLVVILPPSVEILRERLFTRDKSKTECQRRFENSLLEIKSVINNLESLIEGGFVDLVVINNDSPQKIGERVSAALKANKRLVEDFTVLAKYINNY